MEECIRCTIEALQMAKIYFDEYKRHKGERKVKDLLNVIGELKHAERHIYEHDKKVHDEIRALRMEVMSCLLSEGCDVDLPSVVDEISLKLLKKGGSCPKCVYIPNPKRKTYILPHGNNNIGMVFAGYELEKQAVGGAILQDIIDWILRQFEGRVTLPYGLKLTNVGKIVIGALLAYMAEKGMIPAYDAVKIGAGLTIYFGAKDLAMSYIAGATYRPATYTIPRHVRRTPAKTPASTPAAPSLLASVR